MVIWLRYHSRSVKFSAEFTLKSSCSRFSQKLSTSQLWIRNSTANFYLVVHTFSRSIYCSTHTFHFSLFSLSPSLVHLNSCVETYVHPWNVILKACSKNILFSAYINMLYHLRNYKQTRVNWIQQLYFLYIWYREESSGKSCKQ